MWEEENENNNIDNLKFNKKFAQKFEQRKKREEVEKAKTKYGGKELNSKSPIPLPLINLE